MANILVTGSEGFVGKHLTAHLLDEGHEVTGLSRKPRPTNENVSSHAQIDLLDFGAVAGIKFEEYDAVIHTAAHASQKDSFENPSKFIFENQQTTFNLLESANLRRAMGRFVIVSTAAVYSANNSMPLSESSAVGNPRSPYATGKINSEVIARYYGQDGLDVVIARPFNHTGPGQLPGYILPDLYEELTGATQEGREAKFGNLDALKDYTDVRDVVRAYGMLAVAKSLHFDTYNIASGAVLSGNTILRILAAKLGYDLPEDVEVDNTLTRKNEASLLRGDHTRITSELEWNTQIPLEYTVADFVDDKATKSKG